MEPAIKDLKINSTSKQLLEKIRYLHPNLKPDDQLNKLAHELTTLIRDRKITSPNQAEKWIQKQDFIPDNLKKIITVYNSNNSSLTPIEYFFTKTGYNEISQDALLNHIGVSVRPLKSKKVIFVVLFAEIDESAANNKINTIITKFTGKVPKWDPNSYDESIGLLFQLINTFRSNFNLPRLIIEKDFCDNVISNDESEFIELKVCLQKNQDILLSCLMNPSFVQFIFSSINSIAAKVDDTSNELRIAFQARRIIESKNQNNEPIENVNNEFVMKNESKNEHSADSDLTRETDQIKLLPPETEQPKEENQSKDNEIANELVHAEDKIASAGNEEDFPNNPQQQTIENKQTKDDTKPSVENEDDVSNSQPQQEKAHQMEEQNPTDNEVYQESRNLELNEETQKNIVDQRQKNEVGHQNEEQNTATEISNAQEITSTEKEQKAENDLQNDQQTESKEDNLANQHQQEVEQKTETENVHHDESNLSNDQQTENKEDNLANQHQQEVEQKTEISQPQKSEEENQQQTISSSETDHQKEGENTTEQALNEKPQEVSKEEPVSSNSAQNEQNSQESSQEIQERHIKINKIPNVKSATKETSELDLSDSKKSILTTPKKQTKQNSGHLLDENDLVNTKVSPASNNEKIDRPNSNTNENKEVTQQTVNTNNFDNEKIQQNDVDSSQQNASNDNSSNNAEPVQIDLNSPCSDPSDLVARSIQVFNTENLTTVHDPPIKEMCERLRLFMQEHKDDFQKTVTNQIVRGLFDDDKEFKRGFVIYNKNWNQIQAEIEKNTRKYRKIANTKEHVIYAIASTVNSTSNSEPLFNLCYVTKATGVLVKSIQSINQSNLAHTPDPKSATQSQRTVNNTPLKGIVSGSDKNLAQTPDVTKKHNSNSATTTSIPSRYKEASQKLEYEIANELRKIKRGKSLQNNTEMSDRIRKELIANKGKNWTNSDFRDMSANELNYPWVRVYFNMGYEDLIKKARNEYKNHFPQKLMTAHILSVAAIAEDESTNTYTAVVVTGQNKTNNNNGNNNNNNVNQSNNDNNNNNNNDNNNDNNNNNTESTSNANLGGSKSSIVLPNLNLKDNKGSATNSNASFNSSGNQSASQSANATPRGTPTRRRKTRNINDNERSRLFLDCFNEYRQNIGKPLLELNDTLIQPAKDYSRTIMQDFFVSDADSFIKQAYEIPGVENICACATFDSKSNDYVTRMFETMLKQSKEAVESDNDKIAIGYWNDRDKNVAVACFLFRFVKQ